MPLRSPESERRVRWASKREILDSVGDEDGKTLTFSQKTQTTYHTTPQRRLNEESEHKDKFDTSALSVTGKAQAESASVINMKEQSWDSVDNKIHRFYSCSVNSWAATVTFAGSRCAFSGLNLFSSCIQSSRSALEVSKSMSKYTFPPSLSFTEESSASGYALWNAKTLIVVTEGRH